MNIAKSQPNTSQHWMNTPLLNVTLWRHFTLSTTPLRLIAGGIFTLLAILLVVLHHPSYLHPETQNGPLLFGLSLAVCGVMGVLTCLRWECRTRRFASWLSVVIVALLPFVSMTMVECLNNLFIGEWEPIVLILNYIVYWVFYGIVYVFSGSLRLPMLIINPLFFVLGMVNYYVMIFRGTPFLPMDLLAFDTAAKVAAGYDFSLSHLQVISVLLLSFLLIVGYKLYSPRFPMVGKIIARGCLGALSACVIGIYLFTNLLANAGLQPNFWNQASGFRRMGTVVSFSLNSKYLLLSKPDNYNPDEVVEIVTDTVGDTAVDDLGLLPPIEAPTKTPNIICIMNESLSDLSVLGDIQTNIDYMPFLNSLTENTIRGNLAVSIIGGGTSNSEFEFLTGTPLSFFPAGCNAYYLYVKHHQQTLVSALEGLGYQSTAFHPYYADGWNRIAVYDHFGFDRFLSLSHIIPDQVIDQYVAGGRNVDHLNQMMDDLYPGQHVMLRQYISDHYNYQEVINQYEARDPSKPFFLFNVTMQNHGGYTIEASNFQEQVHITDLPGDYAGDVTTAFPQANQFLSLMKYSDEAFAELIAYFEQQEEPTVICMFGDHLPAIEDECVETLLGVNNLYTTTIEQQQKRYTTPFYIWANYDIPEQTIQHLSANYLSSYVMKVAGVEMPLYNQYLLKLSETLPVINAVGTIDANGHYYSIGQSPYEDLLDAYEKVMYNHLFDEDNRHTELY